MNVCLSLVLTLVCGAAALKEVEEFAQSVPDTLKFATDVEGLEAKVQRTAEFMKRFPDMSTHPQKEFTWGEVAKCDGEGDQPLFIVIDNNVYNITEFAQYHPPGPKPLKDHAGQDATTAVKVMNVQIFQPFLHYFLVGEIVDSQKDNSTATQSLMKNSIAPRLI